MTVTFNTRLSTIRKAGGSRFADQVPGAGDALGDHLVQRRADDGFVQPGFGVPDFLFGEPGLSPRRGQSGLGRFAIGPGVIQVLLCGQAGRF